jgi:putative membrane protein
MSPRTSRTASSVVALLAVGFLAACRGGTGAVPAPEPAPAPLTDANIAAIVVAANNADISYAQIAIAKASGPAVRAFAQTMLTDHNAVNKAAVDLVTKLGVTPEENVTSLDMRDHAASVRDRVRELTGAEFDKAYIANEVTYHRDLLQAIDAALIPGAKNAELKALLESTRPAVAHHLAMAEQLKAELGA